MANQELMSLVRSITARQASPPRRRPSKRAASAEEEPEPVAEGGAGDGAGNGAPRETPGEVEGGDSGRCVEADEVFLPRIPFIHVS